ncbi:hypothetical protein BC834DRAFT_375386 [Gloeopeniophorella convolvens]|nr:hypothetical protein BC834DRAFT_375386 [Gloeopeniophorella convolvens]
MSSFSALTTQVQSAEDVEEFLDLLLGEGRNERKEQVIHSSPLEYRAHGRDLWPGMTRIRIREIHPQVDRTFGGALATPRSTLALGLWEVCIHALGGVPLASRPPPSLDPLWTARETRGRRYRALLQQKHTWLLAQKIRLSGRPTRGANCINYIAIAYGQVLGHQGHELLVSDQYPQMAIVHTVSHGPSDCARASCIMGYKLPLHSVPAPITYLVRTVTRGSDTASITNAAKQLSQLNI